MLSNHGSSRGGGDEMREADFEASLDAGADALAGAKALPFVADELTG